MQPLQTCPTVLPAHGRKQGRAGLGPKPVQLQTCPTPNLSNSKPELDRFGSQTCPTLLPAPGRKQGWALLKRPKTLGFPGGGEAARGGGAEFGSRSSTVLSFSFFITIIIYIYIFIYNLGVSAGAGRETCGGGGPVSDPLMALRAESIPSRGRNDVGQVWSWTGLGLGRFGVGQVWGWAGLELDRFGTQTCPTLLK